MPDKDNQSKVEEATLDYTLGNNESAIRKLTMVIEKEPDCFAAWHALTEIYFSLPNVDKALEAGENALALRPEDIHINTSLSRIWLAKGDREKAEKFGAKARMLSWKEELKQPRKGV